MNTLITNLNCYDEHYSEYPEFVGIELDGAFFQAVDTIHESLKNLKEQGLSVNSISAYYDASFFDLFNDDLTIKDNLVFTSSDVENEFNDRYTTTDDGTEQSIEELNDEEFRTEVVTLEVSEYTIKIKGLVKHTDIAFGSDTIYTKEYEELKEKYKC